MGAAFLANAIDRVGRSKFSAYAMVVVSLWARRLLAVAVSAARAILKH